MLVEAVFKLNESLLSATLREPDGSGGKRESFSCHAWDNQRGPDERCIVYREGPIRRARAYSPHAGGYRRFPGRGLFSPHKKGFTERIDAPTRYGLISGRVSGTRLVFLIGHEQMKDGHTRGCKSQASKVGFPDRSTVLSALPDASSMCTGMGLAHTSQSLC